MAMDVLAAQLFKIAAMVLVGFILKKAGVVTKSLQKGLSDLLVLCIMPLDILTAGSLPFDSALSRGLLVSAIISVAYYVLSIGGLKLATRRFSLTAGQKTLFIMCAVFANTGFVGYPLLKGLFGDEGYMYTVVHNLVFQAFISTVGVKMMDRRDAFSLKKFLLQPLVIAPVVAISLYLSPLSMPPLLNDVFAQVGGMMVPTSMIILGASLADIKLGSIFKDKWGYLVSALRLLVFPLVLLLVLRALGIGGVVGATAVVITGLCSGSMCVVFAQRYNGDVDFATRIVMQTMVLMVPALPLLFMAVNWLLPM